MRRRHACSICALLLFTSLATRAHAESSSPALSWVREDGAENCIPLQELATKVEQRLGKPVFVGASSATLHVEGRIARREGGFRVQLTASDARGHVLGRRTLDAAGSDCRALDESLVLVIALAVDSSGGFVALPDGLTEASDPGAELLAELQHGPTAEAKPAPAVSARPSQALPSAPSAPQHVDPRDRFHLRLGVSALLALGLVPDVGLGLGLEPQLVFPGDWLISVRASGMLANSKAIAGGGELSIGALLAAVGVCTPEAPPGWAGLRGCAGARIGVLRIDTTGLQAAHSPRRLLLEPWLEGELGWPLGSGVRLRMQLGASVPAIRDRIQVLNSDGQPVRAYRVSALTFAAGAGLLITLGS